MQRGKQERFPLRYSEAAQADVLIIFSHFCLCFIFVYLPYKLSTRIAIKFIVYFSPYMLLKTRCNI